MTPPRWHARQQHTMPTLQSIINMPPPTVVVQAPPPAPRPAKRTGWARVGSVAKVAGPALATVAALVISLFSLNVARDANRQSAKSQAQAQAAANAAAQKHDAEQVSWYQPSNDAVVISNQSIRPIRYVVLTLWGLAERGPLAEKGGWISVSISMPDCSQLTLKLTGLTIAMATPVSDNPSAKLPVATITDKEQPEVNALEFQNTEGNWSIDDFGDLGYADVDWPPIWAQGLFLNPPLTPVLVRNTTITQAPTCS